MRKVALASLVLLIIQLVLPGVPGASSFPPPANIRITNTPQLNNEEQVFICPSDTNIIIANWRDFRLGYRQIGIGRSTDGGLTWSDSLINPLMQYFHLFSWQSDPTMAVTPGGIYYMSVLDFSPTANNDSSVISFYKSVDKGLSWTGPTTNTAHFGLWFEDKQFITVDRTAGPHSGNLYCSWTRFPNPDRIMFVRSTDGGGSFSDTITVGPVQTSTGCGGSVIDAGQFSIPIVTPNGDIHIFWMGIALDSGGACTGFDIIKHSRSANGGVSFSREDTVSTVSGWTLANGNIDTYSQPVGDADLTAGPFRGNLYLAFANIGPEDALGHSDVDFMRSTDNGQTWSRRYQINDDSNSVAIDHFHPWLICNEDGVLITVFYDQRYDAPVYFKFDLSAAYSFDGGLTFTSNHRISTVSSSPSFLKQSTVRVPWVKNPDGTQSPVAMQPMAGRIGEYIGVTAYYDKINAVWTDTRDGNQEVYTANWRLPLLEPRLVLPANGSKVSGMPRFEWSTGWKQNDDRYRLDLYDSHHLLVGTRLVDTPFVQWSITLADTAYYWKVKAFKVSSGDSSAYSPEWRFQTPCCHGTTGNVDGDPADIVDISDLSATVDFLFNSGTISSCFQENDVDRSGTIDISDLQLLIEFLFNGALLPNCP
jgi:hypothetical protein